MFAYADETKRAELDWEKRHKIIAGVARGIFYLHEYSQLRFVHRNLTPSNILLNEKIILKYLIFVWQDSLA